MGLRWICFPNPSAGGQAQAKHGACSVTCQCAGGNPICTGRTGRYFSGTGTGSPAGGKNGEACKRAYRAAVQAMNAVVGAGSGCYLRHCQYSY